MLTTTCVCGVTFSYPSIPTRLQCSCGSVYSVDENGVAVALIESLHRWRPESPCIRRGDAIRQMDGRCCNGRQTVDVFGCSIHEECTYRNTRAGKDKPQPCLGCDDHESPSV